MKKYLFIAAAATLAACTNETLVETPQLPEEKEVAIDFGTDMANMTRAENSSATATSDLKNYHSTFKVWGYKNIENSSNSLVATEVFDDVVVTYDETESNWTYTPTKFWDKSATDYDYYAAAPSTASWTLNNESETATATAQVEHGRYLTISGVEVQGESLPFAGADAASPKATGQTGDAFTQADKDNDLMIATDILKYANYTTDKVNLHFNHILSRLNIGVKTTVESTTANSQSVKLINVQVYNMNTKGNFDESKATNSVASAGTVNRWPSDEQSEPKAFGFPSSEITSPMEIAGAKTTVGDTDVAFANYKLIYQGLVIPQTVTYDGALKLDGSNAVAADGTTTTFSKPYLYIEYELNGENFKNYYNLAALFNGALLPYQTTNGYKACKTETDATYAFKKGEDYVDKDENAISSYGFKCADGTYYAANAQEIEVDPTDNTKWYYKGTDNEVPAPTLWISWDKYHNTIPVTRADAKAEGYNTPIDFCEGWQNNLWITITPTAIQFAADVYEWATKWDSGINVE